MFDQMHCKQWKEQWLLCFHRSSGLSSDSVFLRLLLLLLLLLSPPFFGNPGALYNSSALGKSPLPTTWWWIIWKINKQRVMIALDRRRTHQQRPESPTVTFEQLMTMWVFAGLTSSWRADDGMGWHSWRSTCCTSWRRLKSRTDGLNNSGFVLRALFVVAFGMTLQACHCNAGSQTSMG